MSYSFRATAVVTFALVAIAPLGAQNAPRAVAPTTLDPMRVTATRIAASEVGGAQSLDRFDRDQIVSTGAFSVGEFLESLPPPEEGTRQLVLVDGRPTFLDPATLPLGMIASIEISRDGSMPHLGAFTNGQVINITLKPNYTGHELGAKILGAFGGGGGQRTVRLSTSAARGSLRTVASLELQRTAALAAIDRGYARNQDHRARGGRDLRLGWGYPAVVQAANGGLAGFANNVALVRPGTGAGAMTGDFIAGDPTGGSGAINQRRFDTAPFRTLIAPAERASLNLQLTWRASERLELTLSGSHRSTRGERMGPPPVTPASAATRVPAAFNPFGQDVDVGLVHVEFGPTRQRSQSARTQFGLGATGKIGATWQWDASLGHRWNNGAQRTLDLDPRRFSAALASADASRRFDPFADATAVPVNAALYPEIAGIRLSENANSESELKWSARGPVAQVAGGAVTVRVDAELTREAQERISNRRAGEEPTRSAVVSREREASAVMTAPFFSAKNPRTGLRRLEAQLSALSSTASDGGRGSELETGLVWAPLKTLTFRLRRSWETDTPTNVVAAGTETLSGEALIDPRRGGEALTEVQAITRGDIDAAGERDQRASFGIILEPPVVPGLKLSANLRVRTRQRMFQDEFRAQDIVNNESALTGRVLRSSTTADDLARGWPGAIAAVDLTPGNTGEARRRDLDFSLEYRMPENALGKVRVKATAERNLESRFEALPGVAFVQESGGSYRHPKWTADVLIDWSRAGWNASARVRHTGALAPARGVDHGLGAYTVLDLNAGWRLRTAARPERRPQEWRVTMGIGNLFDAPPPWADTVSGYRGGSPLGRTYSVAFTTEL